VADALFLASEFTGKLLISLYEPFSESERFTLADVLADSYWIEVSFEIVPEGGGADPLIGEVEAFPNQQWRLVLYAVGVYDPTLAPLSEKIEMLAHIDE
jgi:hypothetical protein